MLDWFISLASRRRLIFACHVVVLPAILWLEKWAMWYSSHLLHWLFRCPGSFQYHQFNGCHSSQKSPPCFAAGLECNSWCLLWLLGQVCKSQMLSITRTCLMFWRLLSAAVEMAPQMSLLEVKMANVEHEPLSEAPAEGEWSYNISLFSWSS